MFVFIKIAGILHVQNNYIVLFKRKYFYSKNNISNLFNIFRLKILIKRIS